MKFLVLNCKKKRFFYSSVMASSLLRSITDFLESGMDEEINNLYDSTLGDSCEDLEISQHRNSRSLELR